MNEKIVKVDIDFNEALRRIAHTSKGNVIHDNVQSKTDIAKDTAKKKPQLPKRKMRFRGN